MPITVRPLPSTMQKAREAVWEKNPVTTKATYTSLSPQPAPDSAQSRNLSVLMVTWGWWEVVHAGMSDTTHKNSQITLPRLLLRQTRCFVFYCISWQQPTTEVLCNKNINIIQTTLSLVCPPQKRTGLSFPHAAAIREVISEVKAIPVQK